MSLIFGIIVLLAILYLLVMSLTRLPWALVLVMVQFPTEQLLQSYFVFFVTRSEAFNGIVGLVAVIAVITTALRGQPMFRGSFNLASICMVLYLIFAATSTTWAPTNVASSFPSGAIAYIALYIFIGPLLIQSLADLRSFMIMSIILGTVVGAMILANPNAEFIRGRYLLKFAGIGLAADSNPLAMADLGGYVAIVAALFRPPTAAFVWLALRIVAIGVGVVLLLDSGSRGQVVMAGLVILAFYPIANRIENIGQFLGRVLLLGLLAAAAVFASYYFAAAGTERRWDGTEVASASEIRINNIRLLLSSWFRNPVYWLGGLGNGAFAYLDAGARQPYVHNILAEALGEFGLIGFSLLMIVIGCTVAAGKRLFQTLKDFAKWRSEIAALLATTVFSFLVSNKQGNIWVSTQTFMLLLIVTRLDRIIAQDGPIQLSETESDQADSEWSEDSGEKAGV